MVLERFTVDVLAENVATQLLEGEPSPKLAHRFFRKGRRDGMRAYDHASVSKLLIDAVHLAGSTLVEDLTMARKHGALRLAECEATIAKHEALRETAAGLAKHEALRETADSAGPPAMPTATLDPPTPQEENRDSTELLQDALKTRQALKRRRETEAIAADARRKQQARASALEAAESGAMEARAEMSKIKSELAGLPQDLRQRYESIKHTGNLLWSRYCNGFVQGEAKRGARGSDVAPPASSLVFTTPAALADRAPSQAPGNSAPEGHSTLTRATKGED